MRRPAENLAAVPFPDLQPVILGGDIGAYSLARTFHQAYQVESIVISSVSTGILRHSRILRHVVEPGLADPQKLLRRLHQLADANRTKKLILLASADWLVQFIVSNREQIPQDYTVPYVDLATLERLTDKVQFGQLCEDLDIPFPKTVVADLSHEHDPDLSELQFPVIAKTANTAQYHEVEFSGKRKVFEFDSIEQVEDLFGKLRNAGYTGKFLVQDRIPGDDSGMRILTCYVSEDGNTVFSAAGQVLLEDHAPGALGNPVAIISGPDEEIAEQAARLLKHVGWRGYANFDLKFDPRRNNTVFFELNPRLGRSNFYITASGTNHVELYIRELLQELPALPAGAQTQLEVPHLYTVIPQRLVRKYALDPKVRSQIRALRRAGRVSNPLWYVKDRHPRRVLYYLLAQLNHFRKFSRHYPLEQHRAAYEQINH